MKTWKFTQFQPPLRGKRGVPNREENVIAVTVFKVFISGEVLFATDLNSSLNQVFDNGEDLGWPRTKSADMNGNELILDADGDTSITADTDDQIDFKINGVDIFVMTSTQMTVNGRRMLDARDLSVSTRALMTARSNELRLNQLQNDLILIPAVFS